MSKPLQNNISEKYYWVKLECKVRKRNIKIVRRFPFDNIYFAKNIKRGDTFVLDLENSV